MALTSSKLYGGNSWCVLICVFDVCARRDDFNAYDLRLTSFDHLSFRLVRTDVGRVCYTVFHLFVGSFQFVGGIGRTSEVTGEF